MKKSFGMVALAAVLGLFSAEKANAESSFYVGAGVSYVNSKGKFKTDNADVRFPDSTVFVNGDPAHQLLSYAEGMSFVADYQNLQTLDSLAGVRGNFFLGARCHNENYITFAQVDFNIGGGRTRFGVPVTVSEYIGSQDISAVTDQGAHAYAIPMTTSRLASGHFSNRFGFLAGVGFGLKMSEKVAFLLSGGYALQHGRMHMPYVSTDGSLDVMPTVSLTEKSATYHGLYGRAAVEMSLTDTVAAFVSFTQSFFFNKKIAFNMPEGAVAASIPVLGASIPGGENGSADVSFADNSTLNARIHQSEVAVGLKINIKAN